jgi:hypothetical protein
MFCRRILAAARSDGTGRAAKITTQSTAVGPLVDSRSDRPLDQMDEVNALIWL